MTKKKQVEQTGIDFKEFESAIAQICEEKGLNKDKVMETVEAALAAAYKKDYGRKSQNITAKMDPISGKLKFYLLQEVVDETSRRMPEEAEEPQDAEQKEKEFSREKMEYDDEDKLPRFSQERDLLLTDAKKLKKKAKVGDIIKTPLETHEDYGRVAAQTAKQVIIQRIREAEKEAMYEEYKEKEEEIINGTIQRIEGQNVFIDLEKATGILFPSEQIRGENYHTGKRIKVFLASVESDSKGPGIILSRAHPGIVKKLFELEVPEIFSGSVEIKAVAREAGSRTKIAVIANEDGLDPIGSCVGQKGTRVQSVIDELGGEKIDIIEWNEEPEKFIRAGLSPAKTISIKLDEDENKATVVVPSDQLSLAIGMRGQNVRLAAKLTGWKIDVVGDEDDDSNIENNENAEEEKDMKKEAKEKKVKNKKNPAKKTVKKSK